MFNLNFIIESATLATVFIVVLLFILWFSEPDGARNPSRWQIAEISAVLWVVMFVFVWSLAG